LIVAPAASLATSFNISVRANDIMGVTRNWTIPVTPDTNVRSTGQMIHRLAARARIRELEYGDNITAHQTNEVVQLSLSHQIASKYTSFVAVSDAPPVTHHAPIKRDVEIAIVKVIHPYIPCTHALHVM
jgi:hypothetical protein